MLLATLGLLAASLALGYLTLSDRIAVTEMDRALYRAQIRQAERQRYEAGLKRLASAPQAAELVVDVGANTVQTVHQAIANVPFTVLEAIPVTRDVTKIVRFAHDAISAAVYGGIKAVNKGAGKTARHLLEPQEPPKPGARKEP